MVKHNQTIRRLLLTNCLSVFVNFMVKRGGGERRVIGKEESDKKRAPKSNLKQTNRIVSKSRWKHEIND